MPLQNTLPISELYPFEVSVIGGGYRKYLEKISRNKPLKPIMVLKVEGKYLVVDGNHRVMAAKTLGLLEIPVRWDYKSTQEMRPYIDALNNHLHYKGYENFPVTLSGDTRQKEIQEEMKEIIPSSTDNLVKSLMVKTKDEENKKNLESSIAKHDDSISNVD